MSVQELTQQASAATLPETREQTENEEKTSFLEQTRQQPGE